MKEEVINILTKERKRSKKKEKKEHYYCKLFLGRDIVLSCALFASAVAE